MVNLEEQIGDLLSRKGGSVATAESCSGGLISHRLTNVAGSSGYFLGGVVSYSNAAKAQLLGVGEQTLDDFGAVSEQVAEEMVAGARQRFGADYAVAATGIAGPGGGTEEKPVGLVYIGVGSPGGVRVERCQFSGSREAIKSQTADYALQMLLECIS